MSVLEKVKKGLNKFWEDLGQDVYDEDENDFPADIKDELLSSKNGKVAELEQAQEQLWESKPTKRSKLASELIVHEDGTIKGQEEKVEEKEENQKSTRGRKPKQQQGEKEITD